MCRWHIATAVAFPQNRNPTRCAKKRSRPSDGSAFILSFCEEVKQARLAVRRFIVDGVTVAGV